jgi:aspartyl-tRNA(Asn)/glutamyl-tRNA(Gln) amidotransferase subunit A
MGRYVLAEDYVRAMHLREVLRHAVNAALDGCDALLLPAQPIPAPDLSAATVDIDGIKEPVRGAMLRLTQLFNISGHPAIAFPAGVTQDGWPIGMQLVGHPNASRQLMRVAARVEPYSTGGDGSVGGGTG